jgi:hypothetical protein
MEGGFWDDVMAQFNAMQPSASGWDGGGVTVNGVNVVGAYNTQTGENGSITSLAPQNYISADAGKWYDGKTANLHDTSGNVLETFNVENPYAMDWQEKLILAGLALGGGATAMGLGGGAGAGAAGAGGGAVGTGAGFVGEGALSGIAGWDAALASAPSWTGAAGAGAAAAAGGGGVTPPNPFYSATGGAGGAGGSSLLGKLGAGASSLLGGSGGGAGGGFDWTSLIGPATSLIGGAAGANAAGKASDAQLQATRDSNALLERMFNKQIELQEPFRQGGMKGMNSLMDELGLSGNTGAANYGRSARDFSMADFNADPGYAWRQSEGEKGMTRAASASGGVGSGKFLKDAMRFNQGLASEEYGNAYTRFQPNRASRLNPLQSLMGAGQTSANTMGQAAQNYGAGASANTLAGGDAKAAGMVGKANAWNGAIGQGLSMYNNSQQQAQTNALMQQFLGR